MLRSEKKNKFIALIIAALLILSVPVALIRICKALPKLTGQEIISATDAYGTITDCNGTVLYDNDNHEYYPELYHSVTGNFDSSVSCLVKSYGKELAPRLRLLAGVDAMTQGNTMTTTLMDPGSLQTVADCFGNKGGAVFAYNYKTGEIYAALSVDGETVYDGNRALSGRYVPGSTMKIVATLVALEQNPDMTRRIQHYCEGSYTLPDGSEVDCIEGDHCQCSLVDALGMSCNGTFAHMIQLLNPILVRESLQQMGFDWVSEQDVQENLPVRNLGDMVGILAGSQTQFDSNSSYNDVWSLIGQGTSWVSLSDMCAIAGAVANGGQSARPYLVSQLENPEGRTILASETELIGRFSAETAETMDAIWTESVEGYYRQGQNAMDKAISYGKTGTAQLGNGEVNKLLLAVSKEHSTAFMIVVENYRNGDPTPISIANTLVELLPEEETT